LTEVESCAIFELINDIGISKKCPGLSRGDQARLARARGEAALPIEPSRGDVSPLEYLVNKGVKHERGFLLWRRKKHAKGTSGASGTFG